MDGLANIFPFVKNFILKILGYFGSDPSTYQTNLVDTPAGLINLFLILIMCTSVFVFVYGGIVFALRHNSTQPQDLENKTKQAKRSFIGGTILLCIPIIAMIAIAIAQAALPA